MVGFEIKAQGVTSQALYHKGALEPGYYCLGGLIGHCPDLWILRRGIASKS
jgi:hypothetical protein